MYSTGRRTWQIGRMMTWTWGEKIMERKMSTTAAARSPSAEPSWARGWRVSLVVLEPTMQPQATREAGSSKVLEASKVRASEMKKGSPHSLSLFFFYKNWNMRYFGLDYPRIKCPFCLVKMRRNENENDLFLRQQTTEQNRTKIHRLDLFRSV